MNHQLNGLTHVLRPPVEFATHLSHSQALLFMIEINQAKSKEDIERANQLNREYLSWCVEEARRLLDEELNLDELYGHSLADQDAFLADTGRLLVAKIDGKIGGTACLKGIRNNACEIKRMYVQPDFRGRRLGHKLVSRLIEEAKEIGYSLMLLDSDPYMSNAHSIYREFGFVDTNPYPEAEMDGNNYSKHMVYMELRLS